MKYSKLYIIPVLVAAIASCTKAEGPEGGVSLEGRAVSISVSVDAAGVSGAGTMAFKSKAAGSPVTRAEGRLDPVCWQHSRAVPRLREGFFRRSSPIHSVQHSLEQ